jgi:hypothetical protein
VDVYVGVGQVGILDVALRQRTVTPLLVTQSRHLVHPAGHRDVDAVVGQLHPVSATRSLMLRSLAMCRIGFSRRRDNSAARCRNPASALQAARTPLTRRSPPQVRSRKAGQAPSSSASPTDHRTTRKSGTKWDRIGLCTGAPTTQWAAEHWNARRVGMVRTVIRRPALPAGWR